jgi:RNA polymerase sigma-70 factor (ECF subfamily)
MANDADWERIADLVGRARSGDDAAFRDLLQRHRAAVASTLVACGVRTADTADELAQLVAVRAWSRLDTLADPRAFPSWVRRIAANAARDHLRRTAARREQELEAAADLAADDSPHARAERTAELRLMLSALGGQDPETVSLLTARAAGTPVAELARAVGVSEGALKMRLSRARQRLRTRLDELRRGG